MENEIVEKESPKAAIIGWIATIVSVLMWFSQIDQIRLNLAGQKGSAIFALAVVANCTLWCIYSMLKRPRIWPVFWANLPGIGLGLISAITAVL